MRHLIPVPWKDVTHLQIIGCNFSLQNNHKSKKKQIGGKCQNFKNKLLSCEKGKKKNSCLSLVKLIFNRKNKNFLAGKKKLEVCFPQILISKS